MVNVKKVKYLILGAGPSGLTFANRLLDSGENNFLVLEKEAEAGGLCRTRYVDGSPVDIGGGHILDTRNKDVDEYVFRFLPEDEWNIFTRDSQIYFKGDMMGSPFESHIWQRPMEEQVEYLKSVAVAGCNLGTPMPERFIEWISWKLGDKIASDYMLPYNQKMFSENLDLLGTYWLSKLPDVSFEDTLKSCLTHSFYGKHPGHATFYYPKKYGYGEAFVRMGERLSGSLLTEAEVFSLDFDNKTVGFKKNGVTSFVQAKVIIFTVPWNSITEYRGLPEKLEKGLVKLVSNKVQIDYFKKSMDYETAAHWIYYPSLEYSFHRILVLPNFAVGSKGYWTETNAERLHLAKEKADYSYLNEYAYPLNTVDKREYIKELLEFAKSCGVYGLGRWGEHEHFNSDVVMERAMKLCRDFI